MAEAGLEKVKKIVGVISKEAVQELAGLEDADIKLKSQIDEDVKRLKSEGKTAEEAAEELKPKYQKKWDDLQQLQKNIMGYAFKEAGIETSVETLLGQDVSIDKTTGEVSTSVIQPKAEAEVAPGVH